MQFFALLLLTMITTSSASYAQSAYQLSDYQVTFEIRNAGLKVDGELGGMDASIQFNAEEPAKSHFEGSVAIKTIDTGIGMRDSHLQKEDYFHEKKYPTITMESIRTEKGDGNTINTVFNLTIKGKEKEVSVPVTYKKEAEKLTLKASFPLNRRDFGVGGNSFLLSDDLKVFLEATFKRSTSN